MGRYRLLSATSGSKELSSAKKAIASRETGFYFYHKGRMTTFEPAAFQKVVDGASQTAVLRIASRGYGLLGLVNETYLVQAHNKATYVDR